MKTVSSFQNLCSAKEKVLHVSRFEYKATSELPTVRVIEQTYREITVFHLTKQWPKKTTTLK